MAKKKATKKTRKGKDVATLLGEAFPDGFAKQDQVVIHLEKAMDVFKRTAEEVVEIYVEKVNDQDPEAANRFGSALAKTKKQLKKDRKVPARPMLGFILGWEHRENDINGMRASELRKEYEDAKEDGTSDDLEISLEDYNELLVQFTKLKDTNEDDARSYMSSALDGRFVVYELDDDGYIIEDKLDFIETMQTWDSGKTNFNYGKIVRSQPTVPFDFIVMGDELEFVTINVKGRENLQKLYAAPLYTPVLATVVRNPKKDQKWWVDKSFNIEEVDISEAMGTKTDVEGLKKVIKNTMTTLPKNMQTIVEKVDAWHRKLAKKSPKAWGFAGFVKGSVEDIYFQDDGSADIILTAEDDEGDEIDLDDMSMWDEDADDEGISFKVKCNPVMTSKIDFDTDTVLYVYGQVYRGNKWDNVAKAVVTDDDGKPIPADMPTINAWGFVADPNIRNNRTTPTPVAEDDYEEEEEEEDFEDDDFEIEDDE